MKSILYYLVDREFYPLIRYIEDSIYYTRKKKELALRDKLQSTNNVYFKTLLTIVQAPNIIFLMLILLIISISVFIRAFPFSFTFKVYFVIGTAILVIVIGLLNSIATTYRHNETNIDYYVAANYFNNKNEGRNLSELIDTLRKFKKHCMKKRKEIINIPQTYCAFSIPIITSYLFTQKEFLFALRNIDVYRMYSINPLASIFVFSTISLCIFIIIVSILFGDRIIICKQLIRNLREMQEESLLPFLF